MEEGASMKPYLNVVLREEFDCPFSLFWRISDIDVFPNV